MSQRHTPAMLSGAFNGFSATGSSKKKKKGTGIDCSVLGIKITCKRGQNHLLLDLEEEKGEMKN